MRLTWLARGLAVTGLSALSAVAAHEGPSALTAGRPLVAALAGAALCAAGIAALLAAAVSRYARAARVRRGDLLAARLDLDGAPGASVLVATLLVCQGGAHIGLILAGVAAHGGPPAALALHALFALAAAGILIAFERLLGAAGTTLAAVIAAALGTLPATQSRPAGARAETPRPRGHGGVHRGRAPPLSAASAL
jgi:hypothetical protein